MTIVLGGFLVLPQVTSAHHPVLSSTVDRPCGPDASWSATATAQSDQDWNKDWRSTHKVGSDGTYSAWSSWTDDQVPYGPLEFNDIPADTASINVYVSTEWRSKSGSGGYASSVRNITAVRPDAYACPEPETPDPTSSEWTDRDYAAIPPSPKPAPRPSTAGSWRTTA